MNRAVTMTTRGFGKFRREKPHRVGLQPPTGCQSNFVHELPHLHLESLGDPNQGGNAGRFLAPFHFADIDGMQVGFFRQFFLTQSSLLAEAANGFADDFLMSHWFCHSCSRKQEVDEINTVHSPLFFPCAISKKRIKPHRDLASESVIWEIMSERKRILVVEDEMPVALMMVFLLSRIGYDVTTARNGREGIRLATSHKFDVITLDVDLPDIKGFEICRELKQRHFSHRTPIVFVTGRPAEEDRQLAFELGAADYIEKPFDMSDFIFRIATHARKSQLNETASIQN
jgi:CheY-like chemotaxis protein